MINWLTDDEVVIVLVGKLLLNELLFVKALSVVVSRANPPVATPVYKVSPMLFVINWFAVADVNVVVVDGKFTNEFVEVKAFALANFAYRVVL